MPPVVQRPAQQALAKFDRYLDRLLILGEGLRLS